MIALAARPLVIATRTGNLPISSDPRILCDFCPLDPVYFNLHYFSFILEEVIGQSP